MIEHRGKWFQEISPAQSAGDVARWTLATRMDVVRHYLPLAAMAYEEDIEHVHQLRVGCRRAAAAMTVWKEYLPAEQFRRVKRMLRRIRRSANDARDDDVLLERLQNPQNQNIPQDGLDELIHQITAHRVEMQAPIAAIYQKIGEKKFANHVASLVDSVAWNGGGANPTFGEFAQQRMATIADNFFQAVSDKNTAAKNLHTLRIASKRLRYAMEIFCEAFCAEFRESIYPIVEHLQDTLGALNDHAIAQKRFQRIVATVPPNAMAAFLASLIQEEWTLFQQGRDAFLTWWTTERIQELQTGLEHVVHTQPNPSE